MINALSGSERPGTYTGAYTYNALATGVSDLDEYILDLENVRALLTNVLQQMDRSSRQELTDLLDQSRLQELVLEAIGVPQYRLTDYERYRLEIMVQSLLERFSAGSEPRK